MENKAAKAKIKDTQKLKSIRVSVECQKKAEKILALANKKKIGRTVKFDQALSIALDLLTDEHIKRLQEQSLTNEDRKELLRQKWTELYGPVSKDAFTGIMMTKEFSEFLNAPAVNEPLPTKAS